MEQEEVKTISLDRNRMYHVCGEKITNIRDCDRKKRFNSCYARCVWKNDFKMNEKVSFS